MSLARFVAIAFATLPAARAGACECPSPIDAFERADAIVVVRIVELAPPPLVVPAQDAVLPEEPDAFRGRAVVTEVLRGEAPRSVALSVSPGMGMCRVTTRLEVDEVIVLPLGADQSEFKVRFCSSLLSFGRHWRGWDEATRGLRGWLRSGGDIDYDTFSRWTYPYLWQANLPPPPRR